MDQDTHDDADTAQDPASDGIVVGHDGSHRCDEVVLRAGDLARRPRRRAGGDAVVDDHRRPAGQRDPGPTAAVANGPALELVTLALLDRVHGARGQLYFQRQSLWELGPPAEAWLTELVHRRPARWRRRGARTRS